MPCNHAVPHLNALHKEYADRGLVLVGVSDEGMATVKKWAEAKGVRYPLVHAPGAGNVYKINGYPTVFSIDQTGRISQRGELTTVQIEERLQQVRWLPDLGTSPLLVELRRHWEGGRFADLDRKLRDAQNKADLPEADATGVARLRTLFDKLRAGTAKELDGLRIGPDFLLAEERLREIEKQWLGFEVANAAKAMQADFKKDTRIRAELDASRKLRDAVARSGKDKKALAAALQALIKRHPGTFAASQAQDLLKER